MVLCEDGHDEVCFEVNDCPVCELMTSTNDEKEVLENKVSSLEDERDDLANEVTNLEREAKDAN